MLQIFKCQQFVASVKFKIAFISDMLQYIYLVIWLFPRSVVLSCDVRVFDGLILHPENPIACLRL